ncbi:MAG: 30S ribosomal protein S21 [Cytophagales bacterium]|nr:30S ribosomal protein S21 [Cytophagales bacterium]MDW8383214.1 30S ribosomal protein S21 [Flammeovirgaceae bacterium]
MLIVKVKENETIDKALKRFKKKFEKTGVLKAIRNKSYYEKPSVVRRNARLRSIYKQRMITAERG